MSFQKILRLLNEGDGELALSECRKILEEISKMQKEVIQGGTTTETHDAGRGREESEATGSSKS